MIRTFVTVAGNLWEMGDFHGCHCIMQGLESPLVHSLTRTWEVCLGQNPGDIS